MIDILGRKPTPHVDALTAMEWQMIVNDMLDWIKMNELTFFHGVRSAKELTVKLLEFNPPPPDTITKEFLEQLVSCWWIEQKMNEEG